MIDVLVKHFIKNSEDTADPKVRTAYGTFSSVVSLCCNLILFTGKLIAGLSIHSVSVIADAVNNLSDAASCVISFIGVRIAGKPADEEHPFGHGRAEYITALIVAFLVLEVGLSFLKDSVKKIFAPEPIEFKVSAVAILLFSIAVKLWMAYFNRKLGRKIESKVMEATATDALGDVATTSATLLSVLVFAFAGVNIDAWIGILVALVIMWQGVGIARDTLEPLLGQSVSRDMYNDITDLVEEHDGILGSHDLIVHSYGPTTNMASIHVEVPSDEHVGATHEIIDHIEREAEEKLGIQLLIHTDPVETEDEHAQIILANVTQMVETIDAKLSVHDFHIADIEGVQTIFFDVKVPFSYTEEEQIKTKAEIEKKLQEMHESCAFEVTVEKGFVQES